MQTTTEVQKSAFMFAAGTIGQPGLSFTAYAENKEQAEADIRKECGPFPHGLLYIGKQ